MRRIASSRPRGVGGWWSSVVVTGLCLGTLAVGAAGCQRGSKNGELVPPSDAEAWENRYGVAFDDAYTREPVNLVGRAAHDVLDQRLFAARLGHSAVVAKVSVDQVWGRGRYAGDQDQYLDVTIERVLMGVLPKNTNEQQLLPVRANEELSADLQGAEMILFVRWAPGAKPPFHHHLMPSDPELEGYIEALIEHAQGEGVINASGSVAGKRKSKRGRDKSSGKSGTKKERKAKAKVRANMGDASEMPVDP